MDAGAAAAANVNESSAVTLDSEVTGRRTAVELMKTGGHEVARAAETALTGSDADVREFIATGRAIAAETDLRVGVSQVLAAGGPNVRTAAQAALDGGPDAMRTFLDTGWKTAWQADIRVRITQIRDAGGPKVAAAAQRALDGDAEAQTRFLETEHQTAQDEDDRDKTAELMATGGPKVKAAAQRALDGTVEDVREFVRQGYEIAAARDAEVNSVVQLADLAEQAGDRAALHTQAAKDAADRAVLAAGLAKEATEQAARETEAARDSAYKAASAAGRAADSARRAAEAAETALMAADDATHAARLAADAASRAATAASMAGQAAANANRAAQAAHADAGQAAAARRAAEQSRDAARGARDAGVAAENAAQAAVAAGQAAAAAVSAGVNANGAAGFANQAGAYAQLAGASAEEARQAAAYAQRRANAAIDAANRAQALAREAASAAAEAKRWADDAAQHAEAAAAAADEAAQHAGEAAGHADVAQQHADEASAAALAAKGYADAAVRVHDLARDAEAARLATQQARNVADAEDALEVENARRARAVWEAGETERLQAEAAQLLTAARAPGTPRATVVANGRRAAVILMRSGGSFVRAAAEDALIYGEDDVIQFVSAVDAAVEFDDRASLDHIVETSDKPALRDAALTAGRGDHAMVKAFLTTGQHAVQLDDYRAEVIRIRDAGGSRVRAAANAALLAGTVEALRDFLETGQYVAREHDDRLAVSQMLTGAGPELNAAAQAALSGPASYLRQFLDVEQYRARQRDADAAAHESEMASYLENIRRTAAEALASAAEAKRQAAIARGAAQEAESYAAEAQAQASAAEGFADFAQIYADQAQASANQAAQSAQTAAAAASRAQAAAQAAAASAAEAAASASQARAYADQAYAAAAQARADAIAAQQDAAAAAQAAADAAQFAEQLRRQEDTERQDGYDGGLPNSGGVDPDVDNSEIRTDEDLLEADDPALAAQYRDSKATAGRTIEDFIISVGADIVLEVIGWNDLEACVTRGDIVGCLFTALTFLGPITLLRYADDIPEIGRAIWRIVDGLGPFRRAVDGARAFLQRIRPHIDDVFDMLRNPCGPVRGTTAAATASAKPAGGASQAPDGQPFRSYHADYRRDTGVDLRLASHYVTATATHPWTVDRKVYRLTVHGTAGYIALAGGAKYCALGQAGEAAVSAATGGRLKNTLTVIAPSGRPRIPDFYEAGKFIAESKNVSYQYLSTQLKDYLAIARREGTKLHLYVRTAGRTRLAEPLLREIRSGNIVLHQIIP